MKTQTLLFWLILIGLLVLGGLSWLAALGYIFAYVALTVIVTVGLVTLGSAIGLLYRRIEAQQQQTQFLDNAQENLSIMSALQSIQNKQNSNLLQQLNHVRKMPEPKTTDLVVFDDGVFEELEQ